MMTVEYLKARLHYDPETGAFVRVGSSQRPDLLGKAAGWQRPDGYIGISVDSKGYLAQVLAWLYMTGIYPDFQIDHRNTNKADNRWNNLRKSDKSRNAQNMRLAHRDNKAGRLGVTQRRYSFEARIRAAGQNISLGFFPSAEGAHTAYVAAKRQLHEAGTL